MSLADRSELPEICSGVELDFYQDWSDETMVFAARGLFAHDGLFIAYLDDTEPEWEFLVPESPRWDSFHQQIFSAHRAVGLGPSELPPSLREVPPMPPGPYPSAASYLTPKGAIPASRHPLTAGWAADGGEVFVVLHEDLWETKRGDGAFHYLHKVFLSEAEARAEMAAGATEWSAFHLRTVAVRVVDGVFDFPGFSVETFDQHRPEQVVAALEGRLTSRPPSG